MCVEAVRDEHGSKRWDDKGRPKWLFTHANKDCPAQQGWRALYGNMAVQAIEEEARKELEKKLGEKGAGTLKAYDARQRHGWVLTQAAEEALEAAKAAESVVAETGRSLGRELQHVA